MYDLRRSLGNWQAIGGAWLAVIGKSLGTKIGGCDDDICVFEH